MIRKCHNHIPQTKPRHHEEEPKSQNIRQTIKVMQQALFLFIYLSLSLFLKKVNEYDQEYHNHTPLSKPRYHDHEEELHNTNSHKTPGRPIKVKQPALYLSLSLSKVSELDQEYHNHTPQNKKAP